METVVQNAGFVLSNFLTLRDRVSLALVNVQLSEQLPTFPFDCLDSDMCSSVEFKNRKKFWNLQGVKRNLFPSALLHEEELAAYYNVPFLPVSLLGDYFCPPPSSRTNTREAGNLKKLEMVNPRDVDYDLVISSSSSSSSVGVQQHGVHITAATSSTTDVAKGLTNLRISGRYDVSRYDVSRVCDTKYQTFLVVFTNLQYLDLHSLNRLVSIGFVSQLPFLTKLSISNCIHVRDLSALSKSESITHFCFTAFASSPSTLVQQQQQQLFPPPPPLPPRRINRRRIKRKLEKKEDADQDTDQETTDQEDTTENEEEEEEEERTPPPPPPSSDSFSPSFSASSSSSSPVVYISKQWPHSLTSLTLQHVKFEQEKEEENLFSFPENLQELILSTPASIMTTASYLSNSLKEKTEEEKEEEEGNESEDGTRTKIKKEGCQPEPSSSSICLLLPKKMTTFDITIGDAFDLSDLCESALSSLCKLRVHTKYGIFATTTTTTKPMFPNVTRLRLEVGFFSCWDSNKYFSPFVLTRLLNLHLNVEQYGFKNAQEVNELWQTLQTMEQLEKLYLRFRCSETYSSSRRSRSITKKGREEEATEKEQEPTLYLSCHTWRRLQTLKVCVFPDVTNILLTNPASANMLRVLALSNINFNFWQEEEEEKEEEKSTRVFFPELQHMQVDTCIFKKEDVFGNASLLMPKLYTLEFENCWFNSSAQTSRFPICVPRSLRALGLPNTNSCPFALPNTNISSQILFFESLVHLVHVKHTFTSEGGFDWQNKETEDILFRLLPNLQRIGQRFRKM